MRARAVPWPGRLAAMLLLGCAGWAAVAGRRGPEPPAHALPREAFRSQFQPRLVAPALPPDRRIDWRDPAVAQWLAEDALTHRLAGTVASGGRRLAVRPWLHTSRWLAQPVVPVENGRFVAELVFDSRWNAPMILRLEMEDVATGQVLGDISYYFTSERAR